MSTFKQPADGSLLWAWSMISEDLFAVGTAKGKLYLVETKTKTGDPIRRFTGCHARDGGIIPVIFDVESVVRFTDAPERKPTTLEEARLMRMKEDVQIALNLVAKYRRDHK